MQNATRPCQDSQNSSVHKAALISRSGTCGLWLVTLSVITGSRFVKAMQDRTIYRQVIISSLYIYIVIIRQNIYVVSIECMCIPYMPYLLQI